MPIWNDAVIILEVDPTATILCGVATDGVARQCNVTVVDAESTAILCSVTADGIVR